MFWRGEHTCSGTRPSSLEHPPLEQLVQELQVLVQESVQELVLVQEMVKEMVQGLVK